MVDWGLGGEEVARQTKETEMAKNKTMAEILDSESPLSWDLAPADFAQAVHFAEMASMWAPQAAGPRRHMRAAAAHEVAAKMSGKNRWSYHYHRAELKRHQQLAVRQPTD